MLKALVVLVAVLSTSISAKTVPFKPGESLPEGVYQVERVIDADTITVMAGSVERSVRFVGINTPELRPPSPTRSKRRNWPSPYLRARGSRSSRGNSSSTTTGARSLTSIWTGATCRCS